MKISGLLALVLTTVLGRPAAAQDEVVLKNGSVIRGEVRSVDSDGVTIRIGDGSITIGLALVARIDRGTDGAPGQPPAPVPPTEPGVEVSAAAPWSYETFVEAAPWNFSWEIGCGSWFAPLCWAPYAAVCCGFYDWTFCRSPWCATWYCPPCAFTPWCPVPFYSIRSTCVLPPVAGIWGRAGARLDLRGPVGVALPGRFAANRTIVRSNTGVGNGVDPQPFGIPRFNGGLGTGLGAPGNRSDSAFAREWISGRSEPSLRRSWGGGSHVWSSGRGRSEWSGGFSGSGHGAGFSSGGQPGWSGGSRGGRAGGFSHVGGHGGRNR